MARTKEVHIEVDFDPIKKAFKNFGIEMNRLKEAIIKGSYSYATLAKALREQVRKNTYLVVAPNQQWFDDWRRHNDRQRLRRAYLFNDDTAYKFRGVRHTSEEPVVIVLTDGWASRIQHGIDHDYTRLIFEGATVVTEYASDDRPRP